MQRIEEYSKIDIALAPQALSSNNIISQYFDMKDSLRALAWLQIAGMAAATTVKLEVFQGISAAGTSGALLPSAVCTIAANVGVTSAKVTLTSVLNAQTLTITVGGVAYVFTADTDTTTPSARKFSIAGSNDEDAALLAGLINGVDYGVPGLQASVAANVITLTALPAGDATITLAASDSTCALATLSAQCFVSVDNLSLTLDRDHIALKVTSTATGSVCAFLLRESRNSPSQKVAVWAAL